MVILDRMLVPMIAEVVSQRLIYMLLPYISRAGKSCFIHSLLCNDQHLFKRPFTSIFLINNRARFIVNCGNQWVYTYFGYPGKAAGV